MFARFRRWWYRRWFRDIHGLVQVRRKRFGGYIVIVRRPACKRTVTDKAKDRYQIAFPDHEFVVDVDSNGQLRRLHFQVLPRNGRRFSFRVPNIHPGSDQVCIYHDKLAVSPIQTVNEIIGQFYTDISDRYDRRWVILSEGKDWRDNLDLLFCGESIDEVLEIESRRNERPGYREYQQALLEVEALRRKYNLKSRAERRNQEIRQRRRSKKKAPDFPV